MPDLRTKIPVTRLPGSDDGVGCVGRASTTYKKNPAAPSGRPSLIHESYTVYHTPCSVHEKPNTKCSSITETLKERGERLQNIVTGLKACATVNPGYDEGESFPPPHSPPPPPPFFPSTLSPSPSPSPPQPPPLSPPPLTIGPGDLDLYVSVLSKWYQYYPKGVGVHSVGGGGGEVVGSGKGEGV